MIKLDEKYHRDDFLNFLQTSFITDFKKDIRPVMTSDSSTIGKAYSLGHSEDLDLQVFEFEFNGSANKRVTLTKDAFQVLKQSATFQALGIFHSSDSPDWRLSFMTASPERTEEGKVSVNYSNPKRYSFFLGPNAKVNTPNKFLVTKGPISNFDDLKSRFSVEVVNKEFYKEISELFIELVGGTLGTGKKAKTHQALLKLPSNQDHSRTNLEFAVRLIGRIIFCWFLREKKSHSGLALMPKELLSLETVDKTVDYYHKILEPIFFEVLNKPTKSRSDDFTKEPFSFVPYLNGGLFSPQGDDYYKRGNEDFQSQDHNTLVIPDNWFRGFFEILETYNFTIDENTAFDEELSIDPEMLGRIFENLLAEINPETGESARKSTGSYYTPRVIVDYMVDESLILYLQGQTNIEETKLRALVSYNLEDDANNPLTEEEKQKIIDALEKVKILDPACGSGAFPMGALQKIVFILQQTDPEGQLWFKKQVEHTSPEIKRVIEREFAHKNFDYIRKLGIIRENIYGVDIQPIATEISRLRCFLTLVVDERIEEGADNRGIEPLPNLDFKFVTANSLIGLPKTDVAQPSMFDDYQKIDELKHIRDQYFTASGIEREQLKTAFVTQQKRLVDQLIKEHDYIGYAKAELTQKLTDWEPFSHKPASWFDPEWMFGIKDGFDIVIANPPYVSINELSRKKNELVTYLKTRQASLSNYFGVNLHSIPNFPKKYPPKPNLYSFFFVRANMLLKERGYISFIVPKGVLTAKDLDILRYFFITRNIVKKIILFKEKVFLHDETTAGSIPTSSLLIFLKKMAVESSYKFETANITLDELTNFRKESVDIENLKLNINNWNTISLNTNTCKLLRKYKLSDDLKKYYIHDNKGKTSNYNFYFDVGFILDKKLIVEKLDCDSLNYYQLFEFKGMQKYYLETSKFYPKEIRGIKLTKNSQGYVTLAQKYKIIWSVKNPKAFSFTDKEIIFPMGKAAIIASNDRSETIYLTALLNSKLTWFVLSKMLKNEGEKDFLVPISSIKIYIRIPVINSNNYSLKTKVIGSCEKIIKMTTASRYKSKKTSEAQKILEKELDQMVYKLYGLTPEEIKIVEENIK